MSDDILMPFDFEKNAEKDEISINDFINKDEAEQEFGFTLVARGSDSPFRNKYRPQKLTELVPTCSVELLQNQIDNPSASQVYLFEGATGTGKTTCARILAKASVCIAENSLDKPCLKCSNCTSFETSFDKIELNTANQNKIDDIRKLIEDLRYHPSVYPKKIYILDEVQRLTDGSQQILLTVLEEPHPYLLVFLCTTDIKNINKALVDRACRITFKNLTTVQASAVIKQISTREMLEPINDDLAESLFYQSNGSVRALLNALEIYKNSKGKFEVDNWVSDEVSPDVKLLFRSISNGDWTKLSKQLKNPKIKKEAESLRLGLENYIRAIMLNKETINEAAIYANAFKVISGSLMNEINISQYNNFVFKCLRACNVFKDR
jgi:DNA polymerase-3 subunit gamma/tau